MKNVYDAERCKELVRRAIGDRTQKEFADIAGLSQYHLSSLLSDKVSGVPRKSTLQKVADASQGRVSLALLLDACGYEQASSVPVVSDGMSPEETNLAMARKLCETLQSMAGHANKYRSVADMLETAALTVGLDRMGVSVFTPTPEYKGTGRRGAERYAHADILWIRAGYDAIFSVEVFFCNTEGGGCIISDCAFDLETLLKQSHPTAQKFLSNAIDKGDVCYADYPIVFTCRKHVVSKAEKELMKAIFGEDYQA